MNSGWSNVKLMGQIDMEFHEFTMHGKLMKQEIQGNHNQVIRTEYQRDILISKSEKIRTKIG